MEKKGDYGVSDLVTYLPVEQQRDQSYWEAPLEILFKHNSENLLGAYAGTAIPVTELYVNKTFSGFIKYSEHYSIRFDGYDGFERSGGIGFSKTFLEAFVHESARIAAYLYYGEKSGRDSWVNGPAVLKILKRCGIVSTERGYHKEVREPFTSVILKKFGVKICDGDVTCKSLRLTN